jgi:hypothetical protein
LSYSGFKSQDEINVLSREKNDYIETIKIFDSLWTDSVKENLIAKKKILLSNRKNGSLNKANIDSDTNVKEKLIIVDECHKYRNNLTKDFKNNST